MLHRVTVAVHATDVLIRGANHVHVLLSKSEGYDTYAEPNWEDSAGNLYCVSSGLWTDVQIAGVTSPETFADVVSEFLTRFPDLDMDAVAIAQAAFGFDGSAGPGRIVAVLGEVPQVALTEMGLTRVEGDGSRRDHQD